MLILDMELENKGSVNERSCLQRCLLQGQRCERTTDSKGKTVAIIIALAVIVILAIGYSVISKNNQKIVSGGVVTLKLKDNDRTEIDDLLRRAESYVEKAQYTDPPEKSAKACIDSIRKIDPVGQYKGQELKSLEKEIVGHYLSLADKANAAGDKTGTVKWIERAKLLNADTETIRDKEREYGLLKSEK